MSDKDLSRMRLYSRTIRYIGGGEDPDIAHVVAHHEELKRTWGVYGSVKLSPKAVSTIAKTYIGYKYFIPNLQAPGLVKRLDDMIDAYIEDPVASRFREILNTLAMCAAPDGTINAPVIKLVTEWVNKRGQFCSHRKDAYLTNPITITTPREMARKEFSGLRSRITKYWLTTGK
jgi:hypothetical protein